MSAISKLRRLFFIVGTLMALVVVVQVFRHWRESTSLQKLGAGEMLLGEMEKAAELLLVL